MNLKRLMVTRRKEHLRLADRRWLLLSYLVMVAAGTLALATFRDYGVTMDEEIQSRYGRNVLAWYTSFFRNKEALSFTFTYGGFFEGLAEAAACIFPFDRYESRHLIGGLFGVLALPAAYRIGSQIYDSSAGFFSVLFLALTPVMYGHSFNNSKDAPFATVFLISLALIVETYAHLPRVPWKLRAAAGISIGIASGIRVGGLILLGLLALFWFTWVAVRWWLKFSDRVGSLWRTMFMLARSYVAILVTSWLVMLLCWPWAQVKPFANPPKALAQFASFNSGIKSLFQGHLLRDRDLPPSYLPTWFSIQLPDFYFVALLAGAVLALIFLLRLTRNAEKVDRAIRMSFVIAAALIPALTVILLRSPIYDAMRHFLFIVPPIAVIAGVSFAAFLRSRTKPLIKSLVGAAVAVSIAITGIDMIRLHPYQYVYFNRMLAGGLKGGSQQFDTDYWGASYKEGYEWVVDNYRRDRAEPITVANCSNIFFGNYYLSKTAEARSRFRAVADRDDPDLFLTTTRYGCQEKKFAQGKVLHIVERQGVPLLYVIERRGPF